jgi:flagellar motor protein MotB
MRAFRFLNLAILSVLVGCSAVVYAQDDKPQDNKPTQQEESKPQPKQGEIKSQDEAKPQQDEAKPSKQDKQEQKQDQKQEQKGHPEQQAGNAGPGGKGGHIPDDKFRAHFGRSHTFTAKTVIVQGQPQFQYGGYTFQIVDVWPVGWAYTDECYIDYIDGEYFLFDLLHPGVRVVVFVVM